MSKKKETLMQLAKIIGTEYSEPVSKTLFDFVEVVSKASKSEEEFEKILNVSPSLYVSFGLAILTDLALAGKIILVRKDGSYGFSKQTTDCDTQKRSAV